MKTTLSSTSQSLHRGFSSVSLVFSFSAEDHSSLSQAARRSPSASISSRAEMFPHRSDALPSSAPICVVPQGWDGAHCVLSPREPLSEGTPACLLAVFSPLTQTVLRPCTFPLLQAVPDIMKCSTVECAHNATLFLR